MAAIHSPPRSSNVRPVLSNKELSGAHWAKRFLGSSSTRDLAGTVFVNDANGTLVRIDTMPRNGMNRKLIAVAASYGVKKYFGGNKNVPHWSNNGR